MACDSEGKTDRRVNQFYKIRLLNDIGNQLINYAGMSGNEGLIDYIDLNCGAIPEGDFDQVIDLSSPHQFLQLYMNIAEDRFAFAVTELLKMNPAFLKSIGEFCFNVGKDLEVKECTDIQQAFEIMEQYVLEGMPCDETKNVLETTEDAVIWEKVEDPHEKSWKKAGGNLENYYILQKQFVDGLFSWCKYTLEIKDLKNFTLKRAE